MNDNINNIIASEYGDSGTAYYEEYISDNFQLTHEEAISGIRYLDTLPGFPQPSTEEKISLVIIDGEIRFLDKGSPPGLKTLSKNSGLLKARRK